MDVSIVIPSYNHEEFVGEAISSAVEQTKPPAEVIVSDDASTDDTPEIAAEYVDEYPETVALIRGERNRGLTENLNRGLEAATGDAIMTLASDDRLRPRKLEYETELLSEPGVQLVYSDFAKIDAEGNVLDIWTDDEEHARSVFDRCFVRDWPENTLFRYPLVDASLLEETGLYDERLPLFEDWDLKIRLTKDTEVRYCPRTLSEYRQLSSGLSVTSSWRLKADSIHHLYTKNRHLLSDLEQTRREKLDEHITELLLRYEALAKAERNEYYGASARYLSYLLNKPTEIKNYKLHATFASEFVGF